MNHEYQIEWWMYPFIFLAIGIGFAIKPFRKNLFKEAWNTLHSLALPDPKESEAHCHDIDESHE